MKVFFNAARTLLADMASTFFFLALMLVTKNVAISVAAGMVLGVIQIAWQKARGERIDLMQGMSLFLVLASGAATLLTNDPRFVMIKPSIIYVVVGIVMLKPGWMVRYLPAEAVELLSDVANVFGYVWAVLMFASAVLNMVLALSLPVVTWAADMSIFALASKIGLFLIQFTTMRLIGRRRRRNEQPAALPAQ
jgi:intracellular septation protein A